MTTAVGSESATHGDQVLTRIVQLRSALVLPAGIAARVQPKAFKLMLVSLISGIWLLFYLWKTAAPSVGWTAVYCLVMLFPGVVLFAVHTLLHSFSNLPERLDAYALSISSQKEAYRQARAAPPEVKKAHLSDLFKALKSARGVWGVVSESREIVSVLGSSLAVMNPVFWLALVGAILMTLGLVVATLITLPLYWF